MSREAHRPLAWLFKYQQCHICVLRRFNDFNNSKAPTKEAAHGGHKHLQDSRASQHKLPTAKATLQVAQKEKTRKGHCTGGADSPDLNTTPPNPHCKGTGTPRAEVNTHQGPLGGDAAFLQARWKISILLYTGDDSMGTAATPQAQLWDKQLSCAPSLL